MFVLIFFADGIFHQSLPFTRNSDLAEWEFEKKMVLTHGFVLNIFDWFGFLFAGDTYWRLVNC